VLRVAGIIHAGLAGSGRFGSSHSPATQGRRGTAGESSRASRAPNESSTGALTAAESLRAAAGAIRVVPPAHAATLIRMNFNRLAALLLLALPLAACASSDKAQTVTNAETADAAEASMPEVRYYVIADT